MVCLLPLLAALFLVWCVPGFKHWPCAFPDTPQQRTEDYRRIVDTGLYEKVDTAERAAFWGAVDRSTSRQLRVIFWYYLVTAVAAGGAGWASRRRYPRNRIAGWLVDRFIVPNISEWHTLLTPWLSHGADGMDASILTNDDHLYRGRVVSHTLNVDGQLTGIYLKDAERYDRIGYLAQKEVAVRDKSDPPSAAAYWKKIAGNRLFIRADVIQTVNTMPSYPSLVQGLDVTYTLTAEPAAPAAVEADTPAAPSPTAPIEPRKPAPK